MQRRRLFAVAAMACAATPASGQRAVVASSAPERIAVTVYRAPYGRGALNLRYLQGFAMVSETRRVRLPRGPAVVRFEGVAEGIIPVSAVVEGLPGGAIEKNRDSRLLSPAALVDGTLGRQVMLTRTDKSTGRSESERATIVAGPSPGIILRTATGIEALRCSGLPERLAFDGVPADLSRKPVLSVVTTSPAARTVSVRLTYLASGFDWRASYVATLAADGRTLDLFAWLTLANSNPESFPEAEVQAVAGRLNRVLAASMPREAGALRLTCYPLGTTTSDLRSNDFQPAEEIVVTASMIASPMMRAVPAPPPPAPPPPPPPEDLGDLKLYRVPARTSVSARGQKQVALLAQSAIPFERRYRRRVSAGQRFDAAPTAVVLVMKNEKGAGLGVPLPAGATALYADRRGERLLLGLGAMTDRTISETIRLAAGTSDEVRVAQTIAAPNDAVLTVSNANPFAVRLELPIGRAGQRIDVQTEAIDRIDGVATWSPLLPPGGRAELRYKY